MGHYETCGRGGGGGGQGEKVLGVIKPHWFGYRKNWQVNLMDKVLRNMAMERIEMKHEKMAAKEETNPIDLVGPSDDDDDDGEEQHFPTVAKGRNCVHYSSFAKVESDLVKRIPISVVRLYDGTFGCMLRGKKFFPLQCDWRRTEELSDSALHYYECGFVGIAAQNVRLDVELRDVAHYCVLLPKLTATGEPDADAVYTLIESEWYILRGQDKIMAYPKKDDSIT